jgi:hypothetical protein
VSKIKKERRKTRTLIERIFYDVVKREMTTKERRLLLAAPKKPSMRIDAATASR